MNVEWMTEQMEGKEAPMPLLAVQAFANTIDVEDEIDWLDSIEETATWLRNAGLATPKLKVSSAFLDDARELRKVVRRLLEANEKGTAHRKAGGVLARLAREHPVPLTADPDGQLVLDLSPADTQSELIAQLIGIVYEAQATGTWPRLKLCENEECAWAFYDNSRNRSGSWCRMGLCGNRLKNRAYRERQRKGAARG